MEVSYMTYIDIGSFCYNFRMFLELFFFYTIFYNLYNEIPLEKKIILPIVVLPLTFIVQIPLEGVGDMVPIIICFISLKKDQENFTLLNALLISATVPYVVSLLISVGVLNNYFLGELKDPMYILLEILLELTVILILRRISKLINLKYFLYQYSSLSSTLLLSFYYLTIQLFLYVAEYFKTYENFIFNIALFLIMQIIFLVIFLVKEIKKKKMSMRIKF